MDIDGEVVSTLRTAGVPAGAEWYALAANYEPEDATLLVRLADMGVDGFFATANDLVVPTEGGWQGSGDTPAVGVPVDRIGCFGPGGQPSCRSAGVGQSRVVLPVSRDAHVHPERMRKRRPLGLVPVVTCTSASDRRTDPHPWIWPLRLS